MKEGATNSIELKAIGSGGENDNDDEACDDTEAIRLMVHFFYHLDYEAKPLASATPTDPPGTTPSGQIGQVSMKKGKK